MEVILSRETHFRKVPKKAAVKILSIFRAKVILKYLFCKEVRKFELGKNFNNLDELGKKMLEMLTILNILTTMLRKLKTLKMLKILTILTQLIMLAMFQWLTRGKKVKSRREREIQKLFLQFREEKEKSEFPFPISRGEREIKQNVLNF